MAKVEIRDDVIDIRVDLFERFVLAERSRRVPLVQVRGVEAHPPLMQLVLHWADQSSVWLSGASTYQGHLVPSVRNPGRTMAIDLEDDEGRIFVEVDDEPCEGLANRISGALSRRKDAPSEPPPLAEASAADDGATVVASASTRGSTFDELARSPLKALLGRFDAEELDQDAVSVESVEAYFRDPEDDADVRRRDPLMQGSFPPPAHDAEIIDTRQRIDVEGVARVGFWLVGVGTLGVLTGTVSISSGIVLGLLVLGAGITACVLGGLAIRLGASRTG
jgi:hypothetical protein